MNPHLTLTLSPPIGWERRGNRRRTRVVPRRTGGWTGWWTGWWTAVGAVRASRRDAPTFEEFCPAPPTVLHRGFLAGVALGLARIVIGPAQAEVNVDEIAGNLEIFRGQVAQGVGLPLGGGNDELVFARRGGHFDGHPKIRHVGLPAVTGGDEVSLLLGFDDEFGNGGVLKVLLEEAGQILSGIFSDVAENVVGGDGLITEGLLEAVEDGKPARVVINHVAQGVEGQLAFVIHIAGTLAIDTIGADHGAVVAHAGLLAIDIFEGGGAAVLVFDKKGFGIGGETFVYPHVRDVAGGDAVPPPFVGALVNDDEIKFQAGFGRGVAAITAQPVVAIGHRALMLHAGVRAFDQLVAVPREGIRAEVFLVGGHH